jgi:formate hydrogenlyase subunit 4
MSGPFEPLIPSPAALATQLAGMLLVLAVAPLFQGVTRKIKARLLGRRGPAVVQPYRDLYRLVQKEVVLATNASWLFRSVPYLVFATTWVAASLIPTFASGLPFTWAADLIAIVGLLATGRFFLALAGLDVGTAFGGIGSSREVMIASLAEPAFIMVVFAVSLVAKSTDLSAISAYIHNSEVGLRVSLAMALVSLMMISIAENGRIPIDNPATHLELTMVHEAMVLEYSGRHLAMIELASALKLVVYVSVIGSIFAPWGIAPAGSGLTAYLLGVATYGAKLLVGAGALGTFETLIAKMRVFRVPEFLGAALMLGLLAVLLLFVSQSF